MASEARGNTKARAYQLTLNEPERYNELMEYITSLKSVDYYISCKEIAPTTGHEHIHIYVHCKQQIKLSVKKCCSAHIERCRGSPKQNIAYIEKEGDIIEEWGDRPHQGIMSVRELRAIEDPDDIPDYKMYNTWSKIKDKERNVLTLEDFDKWGVKVYYIHGDSGSGKTTRAKEIIRENGGTFCSVKCHDGFWHGIADVDVCLYDDFRDSHMRASEFINFIDYNMHTLNVKGGSEKNMFKVIIITSIQDPYTIYSQMPEEARQQWIRRLTIEYLDM